MRCGWCDGETDAEFVDNGVGWQQVTAARCGECGAVQMSGYGEDKDDAIPEENRRRWWMGEDTEWYMVHDLDKQKWFNAREWVEHIFGKAPWDPDTHKLNEHVFIADLHGAVHETYVVYDIYEDNIRVFQTRCGFKLAVAGSGPMSAPTCITCATRP